jgi:hypothetical protein
MKASEIIDKFKNVLLNAEIDSDEKVNEISDMEVNEEIALNEQNKNSDVQNNVELNEEVEAGYHDDDKKKMGEHEDKEMEEHEDKMSKYATKEDLARAIAEVKGMIEKMSSDEEKDVPEELNAEEKQELSAQEPVVEPIAHDPQANVNSKRKILFAQKRRKSTLDRVMETIINKNK